MDKQSIKETFFPYYLAAFERVKKNRMRFAYYTTAKIALGIIRDRKIWMRNALRMNDYMEVEHGLQCLYGAYNSKPGRQLDAAINNCHKGLAEEVRKLVNDWIPMFKSGTFITCFSEHDEQDDLGRLSMWRGYGGDTGVALIVNREALFLPSDGLGVYSSPVAYFTPERFAEEMEQIAKNIKGQIGQIRAMDRAEVRRILFIMFRFGVLCTKHPGFKEECEWRIITSPTERSRLISEEIENVRDVSQAVLKLSLQDDPEHAAVSLELADIIDKIIIGPCEFPDMTRRTLHEALQKVGVTDMNKIVVSDIPLRNF